jgi:hypothetical protein
MQLLGSNDWIIGQHSFAPNAGKANLIDAKGNGSSRLQSGKRICYHFGT